MLVGSYLMADEASSEEEKRLDHGVKALLSGQIDFPLFLEIQIQSFFFSFLFKFRVRSVVRGGLRG